MNRNTFLLYKTYKFDVQEDRFILRFVEGFRWIKFYKFSIGEK